jgi:hypothetical protein
LQVEFLRSHPECSLVFHDAMKVFEGQARPSTRLGPDDAKESLTIGDLLLGDDVPTASMMFRNRNREGLPVWFDGTMLCDWAVLFWNVTHGKVMRIKKFMSAYRIHGGGVYAGRQKSFQLSQRIAFLEKLMPHLPREYDSVLREQISNLSYRNSGYCLAEGDMQKARLFATKSILVFPSNPVLSFSKRSKQFLRAYYPLPFRILRTVKRLLPAKGVATTSTQ